MKNWHKYAVTLGLAFLIGVCQCVSDHDHGFMDFIRHGVMAMIPALSGLKMTLEKEEGINENGNKTA